MKKYCFTLLGLFCLLSSYGQVSLPENSQKPKFSLDLNSNYLGYQGLQLELNGRLSFNKGRSIYLGAGGNGRFSHYLRAGIMKEVWAKNRWNVEIGAGLRYTHSDYTILNQGIYQTLDLEIPIEANFQVNNHLKLKLGLRGLYNISNKASDSRLPNTSCNTRFGGAYVGMSYSFGKKKKK